MLELFRVPKNILPAYLRTRAQSKVKRNLKRLREKGIKRGKCTLKIFEKFVGIGSLPNFIGEIHANLHNLMKKKDSQQKSYGSCIGGCR